MQQTITMFRNCEVTSCACYTRYSIKLNKKQEESHLRQGKNDFFLEI